MRADRVELEAAIKRDFCQAIVEANSLWEFCKQTSKIIRVNTLNITEKYKYAFILSEALNVLFSCSIEDRSQKIDELLEKDLYGSLKFGDAIEFRKMDIDDEKISYKVKKPELTDKLNVLKAAEDIRKSDGQKSVFIRSILTNIVTVYENYLSKVLRTLILNSPEKYLEAKTIKVADLLKEKLTDLMTSVVTSEVETNMYDSSIAVEKICAKDNICIDRYNPIMKQFDEICYRRNLFIHNGGIVNKQYLKNVDKTCLGSIKEGDELICDDIYFEAAIQLLIKVLCSLYYEELIATNIADVNSFILLADTGFDYLCEEKYDIAKHIYLSLQKCKALDIANRTMYLINYLNAQKLSGEINFDDDEINNLDVSIATGIFKLAKLCLQNKHKETYDLLEKIYNVEIFSVQIKEWPIFKVFRDSEYYGKLQEQHPDDFRSIIVERNTEDVLCSSENTE